MVNDALKNGRVSWVGYESDRERAEDVGLAVGVVVLAMVAVECSRTHLHLLDAAEYQQPTLDHMRILLYCCGFMPKASSSGDVACRRIDAAVRLFGRTIFRSRLVPPVGLEPTLEPF
jgi:hypothetical protein